MKLWVITMVQFEKSHTRLKLTTGNKSVTALPTSVLKNGKY